MTNPLIGIDLNNYTTTAMWRSGLNRSSELCQGACNLLLDLRKYDVQIGLTGGHIAGLSQQQRVQFAEIKRCLGGEV